MSAKHYKSYDTNIIGKTDKSYLTWTTPLNHHHLEDLVISCIWQPSESATQYTVYSAMCSTLCSAVHLLPGSMSSATCRAMCAQCAVCAEECAQCAEQYVQSNVCRAMCRGVHLLQISMCSAVCANAMQSPTLLTVG